MKEYLIRIENDVFDIANRLASIDNCYFVVFNAKSKSFEVHNSKQKGDTYCLKVPYESLDCRTLKLVCETKVERISQLIEQMEIDNLREQNKQNQDIISKNIDRYFNSL